MRTIYRDIDALSAAGVPVYSAPARGGGVSLLEGYTLHRAAFTEEEQQPLLTALRSLPGDADRGRRRPCPSCPPCSGAGNRTGCKWSCPAGGAPG